MTREEMEALAREKGVPFNSRTRDDVLAERLAEVPEEVEVEQIDDSALSSSTAPVMVRVVCSNVTGTDGVKHFQGDDFAEERDVAEFMAERGQVVIT